MSLAIRVENLGKCYRLGELGRQSFFRDWTNKLLRRADADDAPGNFWALRDLSFEVPQGQVVAVVGRNGAGKSTLLKILSAITSPTRGAVKLKGRVAALLEVGTGFHQELTGRDNVYLNGAILGMGRREIAAKFDEIVEFSGIEEFMDTPVKRYSSGMRVRLAFAVAAHLEPEILIIDEVLAVGDASFQQKCLGKIGEVAGGGRTVLFVSHNPAAVEALCTRGMVLEQGRLVFEGTQTEALARYSSTCHAEAGSLRERTDRTGSGAVKITRLELRETGSGRPLAAARAGQDIELRLHYECAGAVAFPQLNVRLNVTTLLGIPVFTQSNTVMGTFFPELPPAGMFVCRIAELPLPAATYRVEFQVASAFRHGEMLDHMQNAFEITVEGGNIFGTGHVPAQQSGLALVRAAWRLEA